LTEGWRGAATVSTERSTEDGTEKRLTLKVGLDVRQVRVRRLERRLGLDQLERVGLGRADRVLGGLADRVGLVEGTEAPGEGDPVAPVAERGKRVGEAGGVAGLGGTSKRGQPALGGGLRVDVGRELDANLLVRRQDGLGLELVASGHVRHVGQYRS
jgi:hypothetical protein